MIAEETVLLGGGPGCNPMALEVADPVAGAHDVDVACGKGTPDLLNSVLSGEDELQTLISEMTSDHSVTSGDSLRTLSPFWSWPQYEADSLREGDAMPTPPHGNAAVVPSVDTQRMHMGRAAELSPETDIPGFFFGDQHLSPATPPRMLRATPDPFAGSNSGSLMMASRMLSYDSVSADRQDPSKQLVISIPRQALPKTPQKSRKKRVTKQSAPTIGKAQRSEKEKSPVAMDEDERVRAEKSKQSARDCRRRKKMYIENITQKANELRDREKKRLARIDELRGLVERLEVQARQMGIHVPA